MTMDKQTLEELLRLTYINPEAIKKAKKADWLANVEALHTLLDSAGIPRGNEQGAYTLYFRICGLRAERDNVVSEKLRDLDEPQAVCGHTKRFVAQDEEGTASCLMCNFNEVFMRLVRVRKLVQRWRNRERPTSEYVEAWGTCADELEDELGD